MLPLLRKPQGISIYIFPPYTVWPEILAGRYFGGLLKLRHLMEFTLAIEQILAIMIFIAKSNALGI